jgi:hypothetical protein
MSRILILVSGTGRTIPKVCVKQPMGVWGAGMPEYRVYMIGPDGRFLRAVELVSPDDETAKVYAMNLVDGHDVELWQGERKIEAFQHSTTETVP